ncbi:dCTP deaminase [Sphaerimonospora mesophila]|uniref:dCTP deaminase n=1 Tax=Sphaerimonospora mesophila TaxID=37483 RepID=UPI0006E1B061
MILTGPEIARAVAAGEIHIDDFSPARLEPNSYGFRLAPDILCYEEAELDSYEQPKATQVVMGHNGMVLEPGRFYLGSTMEAMGSPHYAATLYACRSVSTLGMWIQFSAPLGHSGAIFPWTLEISVANALRVYSGMTIGKLSFWSMQGEPHQYVGKYTGSTSAVASRLSEDVGPAPLTTGSAG